MRWLAALLLLWPSLALAQAWTVGTPTDRIQTDWQQKFDYTFTDLTVSAQQDLTSCVGRPVEVTLGAGVGTESVEVYDCDRNTDWQQCTLQSRLPTATGDFGPVSHSFSRGYVIVRPRSATVTPSTATVNCQSVPNQTYNEPPGAWEENYASGGGGANPGGPTNSLQKNDGAGGLSGIAPTGTDGAFVVESGGDWTASAVATANPGVLFATIAADTTVGTRPWVVPWDQANQLGDAPPTLAAGIATIAEAGDYGAQGVVGLNSTNDCAVIAIEEKRGAGAWTEVGVQGGAEIDSQGQDVTGMFQNHARALLFDLDVGDQVRAIVRACAVPAAGTAVVDHETSYLEVLRHQPSVEVNVGGSFTPSASPSADHSAFNAETDARVAIHAGGTHGAQTWAALQTCVAGLTNGTTRPEGTCVLGKDLVETGANAHGFPLTFPASTTAGGTIVVDLAGHSLTYTLTAGEDYGTLHVDGSALTTSRNVIQFRNGHLRAIRSGAANIAHAHVKGSATASELAVVFHNVDMGDPLNTALADFIVSGSAEGATAGSGVASTVFRFEHHGGDRVAQVYAPLGIDHGVQAKIIGGSDSQMISGVQLGGDYYVYGNNPAAHMEIIGTTHFGACGIQGPVGGSMRADVTWERTTGACPGRFIQNNANVGRYAIVIREAPATGIGFDLFSQTTKASDAVEVDVSFGAAVEADTCWTAWADLGTSPLNEIADRVEIRAHWNSSRCEPALFSGGAGTPTAANPGAQFIVHYNDKTVRWDATNGEQTATPPHGLTATTAIAGKVQLAANGESTAGRVVQGDDQRLASPIDVGGDGSDGACVMNDNGVRDPGFETDVCDAFDTAATPDRCTLNSEIWLPGLRESGTLTWGEDFPNARVLNCTSFTLTGGEIRMDDMPNGNQLVLNSQGDVTIESGGLVNLRGMGGKGGDGGGVAQCAEAGKGAGATSIAPQTPGGANDGGNGANGSPAFGATGVRYAGRVWGYMGTGGGQAPNSNTGGSYGCVDACGGATGGGGGGADIGCSGTVGNGGDGGGGVRVELLGDYSCSGAGGFDLRGADGGLGSGGGGGGSLHIYYGGTLTATCTGTQVTGGAGGSNVGLTNFGTGGSGGTGRVHYFDIRP